MLLGVISCSLRSVRHNYRGPLADRCCRRRPSCLPGQLQDRECHAPRRRRGARPQSHHDCRGGFSETGFSIVLASAKGASGIRMDHSPGRLIGRAYPYVAMDPAWDNEHDPADQDSRTSFPDKDASERSRQQTIVPPSVLRPTINSPVFSGFSPRRCSCERLCRLELRPENGVSPTDKSLFRQRPTSTSCHQATSER